jgi:nitrous-oxide reductase
MIWQYMVKTADVGIRAKDLLVKKVAKPMTEAAARGEEAFNEGGCGGCHVIGKVSSGPDLTGVLQRHENGEKWVADFIKDPKSKYEDDYVKSMINYFNLRMPNQGMSDAQIKDMIEYLKWVDENANLF